LLWFARVLFVGRVWERGWTRTGVTPRRNREIHGFERNHSTLAPDWQPQKFANLLVFNPATQSSRANTRKESRRASKKLSTSSSSSASLSSGAFPRRNRESAAPFFLPWTCRMSKSKRRMYVSHRVNRQIVWRPVDEPDESLCVRFYPETSTKEPEPKLFKCFQQSAISQFNRVILLLQMPFSKPAGPRVPSL
jgi:hypothetical protein